MDTKTEKGHRVLTWVNEEPDKTLEREFYQKWWHGNEADWPSQSDSGEITSITDYMREQAHLLALPVKKTYCNVATLYTLENSAINTSGLWGGKQGKTLGHALGGAITSDAMLNSMEKPRSGWVQVASGQFAQTLRNLGLLGVAVNGPHIATLIDGPEEWERSSNTPRTSPTSVPIGIPELSHTTSRGRTSGISSTRTIPR